MVRIGDGTVTATSARGRVRARKALLVVFLALAVAGSGCLEAVDTFKDYRERMRGPGEAAEDYLTNDRYSNMLIEFNYPRGSAPNDEAVQHMKSTLKDVLPKATIRLTEREGLDDFPARGENGKYSMSEVREYESVNREHHTGDDTAVLYIMYVDGGSAEDQGDRRVLGAHYQGSSIVMFKGNIKAASRSDNSLLGFQATEACVERAVLLHEVGHALGLVNMGAPMQHAREAPDYPGHSKYEDSVMYHAVQNTYRLQNAFSGGCSEIPYEFDEYDLADLRAVREGE